MVSQVECENITRFATAILVGTASIIFFLLLLDASSLVSSSSSSSEKWLSLSNPYDHEGNKNNTKSDELRISHLRTVMCTNKDCRPSARGSCRIYDTPLETCYNGHDLFPNDSSWIDSVNIIDSYINESYFQRAFYEEFANTGRVEARSISIDENETRIDVITKGPCDGEASDIYTLPINECVGPFGKPRPWGKFLYVDGIDFSFRPTAEERVFGRNVYLP